MSSGSVSGMNLYIPPYVQAGKVSPGPPLGSGGFADLGLPPGHRQSLNVSRYHGVVVRVLTFS